MRRVAGMIIIVVILLSVCAPGIGPAGAQGDPDAWPTYRLRMRTGPGADFALITTLPPGTGVKLEARNADTSWLLAHTMDGALRGWLAAIYLGFADGVQPWGLPLSEEIVPAPAAPPGPPPPSGKPPVVPAGSGIPPQVAAIDLHAYPVVPANLGQARTIFLNGRARGNHSGVVAKVGDCASGHPDFLGAFARSGYTLGAYEYLGGTIVHFGESLAYFSWAASSGFNSGAVLDSTWADPSVCQPTESPLTCEFRLHRPAVAVIMFGTTDLQLLSPGQFNANLRRVIETTINAGVIPLLSTFPPHLAYPDESILYNQIVVKIAQDYNIPLMNLWLALEPLPNWGMAPDGNHLSEPLVGGPGVLTPGNLAAGLPMRNLVTLQALHAVLTGAMY